MQKSGWHLERSGTMTREKRVLDPGDDNEDGAPDTKRRKVPALARYGKSFSFSSAVLLSSCERIEELVSFEI